MRLLVGLGVVLLNTQNILANASLCQTTDANFPVEFSNNLTHTDSSIRLFGDPENNCLFKRYTSYNVGDEIWYKTCDASNANINKAAKYHFRYSPTTRQVFSVGSELKFPDAPLCFRISNLAVISKQRVRLANCDSNDEKQQFTIINGRLHVSGNERLCVGFEAHVYAANGQVAVTSQECYPNVFGQSILPPSS